MSNGKEPRFEDDLDPRQLSAGEWRVLTDYRLRQIESRVNSIFRAMVSTAVIIGAGVIVYWLTNGGPARSASGVLKAIGL